jgi:ribosomal protein L22
MNPKKFKTVEACQKRLDWLEIEIARVAENIKSGFVSEKSDIALLKKSLEREQSRLSARREALKTNEFPRFA